MSRPSPAEDRLAATLGARVEWFPFGYEYEVLYPGITRLFGFDDRLVHEADRDGKYYVIEDLGSVADISDRELEDVLDEQVRILEFETEEARENYLEERFIHARPWLRDWVLEAREGR